MGIKKSFNQRLSVKTGYACTDCTLRKSRENGRIVLAKFILFTCFRYLMVLAKTGLLQKVFLLYGLNLSFLKTF